MHLSQFKANPISIWWVGNTTQQSTVLLSVPLHGIKLIVMVICKMVDCWASFPVWEKLNFQLVDQAG